MYPASSFFSPELGSKSVLGFFSKCLLSGHERGIASRSRITKQRPTSRFEKEMQKKFDVGVLPLSSPSISVFAIPPSTKGRKCLRSAALRPLPQTWGRSSLRKLLPITLSYRYTQYVSTHLSTNQNHSQTPTFKREKSCNLFSAFGKSAVRSL